MIVSMEDKDNMNIDLQLLMFARYGELGEHMDGAAMAVRAARILSDESMFLSSYDDARRDGVYGPFISEEGYRRSLVSLVADYSETLDSFRFRSVEQAYQYAKTFFSDSPRERIRSVRMEILSNTSGGSLRALGRSLSLRREEWERVKYDLMKELVYESYSQNPSAARELVEKTAGKEITHEQDSSEWAVLFPKALTEVRDRLAQEKVWENQAVRYEPKMFVSCAEGGNHPSDRFVLVSLSDLSSGEVKDSIDFFFESAYSTREMADAYMSDRVDEKGCLEMYRRDVLEANREKILDGVRKMVGYAAGQGKDICFLGLNQPGESDIRYTFMEFLSDNGFSCSEVARDRMMYDRAFAREHQGDSPADGILFSESKGGYPQRTLENATADDVDLTFGFAVNFSTYGERCTMKAAGDTFVRVDVPLLGKGGIDLSSSAVAKAVESVYAQLPDEVKRGVVEKPYDFGLNVAGNGLATMAKSGVTQEQCDRFVTYVLNGLFDKGVGIRNIRSGGQTGFDEAGIAAGLVHGIPVHVHAPAKWVFRGVDGKDVWNSPDAFKERFFSKDIEALRRSCGVEDCTERKKNGEEFSPKVYVSCYGSRNLPSDGSALMVQISSSRPKGFEVDAHFESVYPDYNSMVKPSKDGSLGPEKYAEMYSAILERNSERIFEGFAKLFNVADDEHKDICLLCWEKPGDFCHRYLLNNFLNENGIACQELPQDRQKYGEGAVVLFGEEGYSSDAVKNVRRDEKDNVKVSSGPKL